MQRFSDNVHDLAGEAMPIINIPVVREDMTDSGDTINCNLPENQNNDLCNVPDDIFNIIIFVIILVLISYGIIIWAAIKTKSEGLKIFLIVSLFLPFFTPISFILALLIIVGVIQ